MSLMAFLKFLAFIAPLTAYLLIILCIFPISNSGFIALGVLGSIIVGLSLVNIIGYIDNMNFGHVVTLVLFVLGALCITISSIIIYTPSIYDRINEDYVSFYFVTWSLIAVSGIYYPFFRHAISIDLRKNGVSKSSIKKKMDGYKNFWWYESLKNQVQYQWVLSVNKLFTIVFPCVCIFQLLLGWWSAVFLAAVIAVIVLLLLNICMSVLIIITQKYSHTEKPNNTVLITLGLFTFPIAATVGLIIYYSQYM